jgi:hypothetical protein
MHCDLTIGEFFSWYGRRTRVDTLPARDRVAQAPEEYVLLWDRVVKKPAGGRKRLLRPRVVSRLKPDRLVRGC